MCFRHVIYIVIYIYICYMHIYIYTLNNFLYNVSGVGQHKKIHIQHGTLFVQTCLLV